jgi:WD40 repeat protein
MLRYGGAVDLEKLRKADMALYNSTLEQINSFGQTPRQLFFKSHPVRSLPSDLIFPMFSSISENQQENRGYVSHPRYLMAATRQPLLFVKVDESRELLLAIDRRRSLYVRKWKALTPDSEPPFLIYFDEPGLTGSSQTSPSGVAGPGRLGIPFATNAVTSYTDSKTSLSSLLFACHPKKLWIFSCGHWDHSVRITEVDEKLAISCKQSLFFQHDVVTCVKISEDGNYLVSGSSDNTVAVSLWQCICGLLGLGLGIVDSHGMRLFYI